MSDIVAPAPAPPILNMPPPSLIPERDVLAPAFDLPCILTLEIPVSSFTVGSLIRLAAGSIVTTSTPQNEDLDLSVNGQLVGPVEIEVTGDNLAVRLIGIA